MITKVCRPPFFKSEAIHSSYLWQRSEPHRNGLRKRSGMGTDSNQSLTIDGRTTWG